MKNEPNFKFSDIREERKIWQGISVFLVVLGWMILLTQGLPFVDADDLDRILLSQDTPWRIMIENLLVPWSKAHHWVAQTSLVDQVIGRRLLLGFILKTIVSTFEYRFFPYYLFTKVLFFSGTVTMLFLLLRRVTKRFVYAVMGTLFFLVVPAHYLHTIWISASETMLHFFMILCLWIYMQLVSILDRREHALKFWIWLICLLATGWLAMKTKETAIILPISLGFFTLIQTNRWKDQTPRLIALIFIIMFLAFLLVPVEHLQNENVPGFKFNWITIKRVVFRNYGCGYDDEPTSAFVSLEALWPVSVSRTITFPLLWTFILLMGLYTARKLTRKSEYPPYFTEHSLVKISLFWILSELILMGFFQPDPRYFSGTMIPLTIVGAQLIQCVLSKCQGKIRNVLAALVILSVSWSIAQNFQHTIWTRQRTGKRAHSFFYISKTIYEDQFPQKELVMRDLGLYYSAEYVPPSARSRPRLKEIIYHSPLEYEEWNQTNSPSLEDFERKAKMGLRYYVTDRREDLSKHSKIKLLKILNRMNKESFFERALYRLKGKSPVPYYIYKYV